MDALDEALDLRRELQDIDGILGVRLSTHGLWCLRKLLEQSEQDLRTRTLLGEHIVLPGTMPVREDGTPIPVMIDPLLDIQYRYFGIDRVVVDRLSGESITLNWTPGPCGGQGNA